MKQEPKFTRKDIAENLKQAFSLTRKEALVYTEFVFDNLEALADAGNTVYIHRLGTFKVKEYGPRGHGDYRRQTVATAPASRRITFKATKKVNN